MFSKKFTPFSKLSRHKKRDLYIQLRGKIKKTASEYGENFTSRLWLNESGRPALFNQYFCFYFLGLDGVTIWNAILYTASQAYWDAIKELSFEKAYRICPRFLEEKSELKDIFIPVYHPVTGKKLHYIMKEPEKYAEFGNRTFSDFTNEYASKLIREYVGDTAPIFEEFRIDTKYQYGVGLYAVMDVPEINVEAIEAMIAKFRSIGEKDWKNPVPVDRSKLPNDTFEVLAEK